MALPPYILGAPSGGSPATDGLWRLMANDQATTLVTVDNSGNLVTIGTITGNSVSGLTLAGQVSGVTQLDVGIGTLGGFPAMVVFDAVNSRIVFVTTGGTAGNAATTISDRLHIIGASGQSADLFTVDTSAGNAFKIDHAGTVTITAMSGANITANTIPLASLANIAAGLIGRDSGTGAASLRTFAQIMADLSTQAAADFDWNGHKNINMAPGTAATDSATTLQLPGTILTSGKWSTFPNTTPATNALAINTAIAVPMLVPVATSIASIGIEVTTGGTTGSVIRFGIYSGGAGLPVTPLFRSGTGIASTTSAALAEDTSVAGTIIGPGVVWLVYDPQGVAPTVRICTPTTPIPVPTPVGNSSNQHTITQGSLSGALPSPWTGTTLGGNAPMIFVKPT